MAVILGIESSCDDTSAAVVDGLQVLSNIISSQVDMHAKWGGVVPEAAARAHVEAILPVIDEALEQAGKKLEDVEAVAVTNRPGLVGALSVGVSAAKALCLVRGMPLVGVHHLEGHILSPLAAHPSLTFPHICLIVSGGHTEIVRVEAPGQYSILGQTIDDAAGEAFDKSARLLGLGYPGGKALQELAENGDPHRYALPRGLRHPTYDFSFSGLKTAVMRLVDKEGTGLDRSDAAASIQEAIVSVLSERTIRAAEEQNLTTITIVGGVAANSRLRALMKSEADRRDIQVVVPTLEMCTDNAAMIGIAGHFRLAAGEVSGFDLECLPNAPLGQ